MSQGLGSSVESRCITVVKLTLVTLSTSESRAQVFDNTLQQYYSLRLEGHSAERMYLRQRCFEGSVNTTILKARLAAATGRQYVYVGFSRRKIPRSSAYTISEKAIRFRHLDYNPDRAQKLTCSSMCRHRSTCNISSKSMDAFLSNLANRQTDRQTNKRGQKHLPSRLSEVIISRSVTVALKNSQKPQQKT